MVEFYQSVSGKQHRNESLGSIKGGEFVDWLSNYWLSVRTAPWSMDLLLAYDQFNDSLSSLDCIGSKGRILSV
jgi:hypothetical protein